MNGRFADQGKCKKCGLLPLSTPFGEVDPCLGVLPGVSHACCGHGQEVGRNRVNEPYVVIGGTSGQSCTTIENGVILRGEAAETFFALVRDADERLPKPPGDGYEYHARVADSSPEVKREAA